MGLTTKAEEVPMQKQGLFTAGILVVWTCWQAVAGTVWLDELDLSKVQQDWGRPHRNQSVEGHPLRIAGKTYQRGLGTHAESVLYLDLNQQAERFIAYVGVDDEVGRAPASVEFELIGDGKILWQSGIMRTGQPAKLVDVSLKGIRQLILHVTDGGDGINYDHADWVMARFMMASGRPRVLSAPKEEPYILTPKPPRTPQIHGPRVIGCRPGHPFLYRIPATGLRPMRFAAFGLPKGLKLDPQTGIITGRIPERGSYPVRLRAKNAYGTDERVLTIRCGDTIALTPPMGWNSWNCFAGSVTAEKVLSAAKAMVESGLADHGWTYINIDDFWTKKPGAKDPTLGGPGRDAQGRIVPNLRFPDMKGLCDAIHRLGLKVGIYSSPGPYTCGGCLGSFDHEFQDAKQFAAWGIDYLKYDWCSYRPELEKKRTRPAEFGRWAQAWEDPKFADRKPFMVPYALMRHALDQVDRDIVYSLCQYGMAKVWEWGARVGGNCWRTTGDIRDTWGSMSSIGFGQAGHEKYAGPGHWNDPDMLVVGKVGWGPHLRPTRLTPNEQYTHISLWCLLSAPLLLGCDLTQLDEFTLNLLTNDEVLEVNQDPLGRQASRIAKNGGLEVWAKPMQDGSFAVGLFNRTIMPQTVRVQWTQLGLKKGPHRVRDLWRQKDLGMFEEGFSSMVPPHGVRLIRVW